MYLWDVIFYDRQSAQRLALCPFGVLVSGTRGRHFAGTSLKPRKVLENAQTPTPLAPAYFAGVRCTLCWALNLMYFIFPLSCSMVSVMGCFDIVIDNRRSQFHRCDV